MKLQVHGKEKLSQDQTKIHFACSRIQAGVVPTKHVTRCADLRVRYGTSNKLRQLENRFVIEHLPTRWKPFVLDQRVTQIKCDGFHGGGAEKRPPERERGGW